MQNLALLSILAGGLSLIFLLTLHFTSPEFKPSWRMVSEYALGKHKRLLSLFFYFWGLSSLLLALYLVQIVSGFWVYFAIVLLAISGIGAICGGLFDINHKKHGLAFALGVPTLPISALILSYNLSYGISMNGKIIILLAHSTWISLILMAISMMLMFSGFKKAGITWDKDSAPPTEVPDDVIALGGYANRLLVLSYIIWVMSFSYTILQTI